MQIGELLMRDIRTGRLADGERLAPERDMAAALSISVGTLRKALAELEHRGLLDRVQGSGNYIRHPDNAADVYALFRLELTDGGGHPSADLLSVRRMNKPADLPAFGGSRHAFRFRRLRRLDGEDAAMEEIWLDGSTADIINAPDVTDSLYAFYRQHLGVWIVRVEDRVAIAALPGWAEKHIENTVAGAWGFVERLARDQQGNTVEYSRTWFHPERVRFVAR